MTRRRLFQSLASLVGLRALPTPEPTWDWTTGPRPWIVTMEAADLDRFSYQWGVGDDGTVVELAPTDDDPS